MRWIYGKHAVLERLKSGSPDLELVVLSKGMKEAPDFERLAKAARVKVEFHERKWLDDKTENAPHQGVLASAREFKYAALESILKKAGPTSLLVALDSLEDPHNLGAILRSCECAGVLGVVIPKDRAVQVTPVVEKVSAGASSLLPIASVTNLSRSLEEIKEAGFWVYGLAGGGESIYSEKFSGKVCLVMGAEGKGLRDGVMKHCDKVLGIPLRGKVQSLNVSVAAGVVIFEVLRQFGE